MGDQSFLAALADLADEVSRVNNAIGATQPRLVASLQQKVALARAAGGALAQAKDAPPGIVEAGPLAHGVQRAKGAQPVTNDGSTTKTINVEWGTTGCAIGLRLGVQGITTLTRDLWVQAMQNLELSIKFGNGNGSLFNDGQDAAFVPFYDLVKEDSPIWRFSRPFEQKETWTIEIINRAEGIDDVIPSISLDFIDYRRIGA